MTCNLCNRLERFEKFFLNVSLLLKFGPFSLGIQLIGKKNNGFSWCEILPGYVRSFDLSLTKLGRISFDPLGKDECLGKENGPMWAPHGCAIAKAIIYHKTIQPNIMKIKK